MPAKRKQARSVNLTFRKTRVTWPKLDCLKPNPDRGIFPPPTTDGTRKLIKWERHVFDKRSQYRTSPHDVIPGKLPGRRDEWAA